MAEQEWLAAEYEQMKTKVKEIDDLTAKLDEVLAMNSKVEELVLESIQKHQNLLEKVDQESTKKPLEKIQVNYFPPNLRFHKRSVEPAPELFASSSSGNLIVTGIERISKADILYNRGRWTPQDTEELVQSVELFSNHADTDEMLRDELFWKKLSTGYRRLAVDVRNHYVLQQEKYDTEPFSSIELQLIQDLKQQGYDWSAIASELKTKRSPFQCYKAFAKAEVQQDSSEFTEEEANLFSKAVKYYGDDIKAVSALFEHKSLKDCQKYFKSVTFKKSKWTPEEDELLTTLVSEHGKKWAVVSRHIPGRSTIQCRERFERNLPNATATKNRLTASEIKQLLRKVQRKAKVDWNDVAKDFPGCSPYMLLRAYRYHSSKK